VLYGRPARATTKLGSSTLLHPETRQLARSLRRMVELKRTLQSISKPQSVSRGDFHGSTPDFIQATDLAGKPTMMVEANKQKRRHMEQLGYERLRCFPYKTEHVKATVHAFSLRTDRPYCSQTLAFHAGCSVVGTRISYHGTIQEATPC
jgi:hypothetical protein